MTPNDCPFCGGTDIKAYEQQWSYAVRFWRMCCHDCYAMGPSSEDYDITAMTEAWNRGGMILWRCAVEDKPKVQQDVLFTLGTEEGIYIGWIDVHGEWVDDVMQKHSGVKLWMPLPDVVALANKKNTETKQGEDDE